MPLAHKAIVERNLCWDRVEARLERYPAIRESFDLDLLKRAADKPPWYCHYVAWVLGAWHGEGEAARLSELLALGSSLEGWAEEFRALKKRPSIGDYWSLVWQLQVAEFLVGLDTKVCWQPGGGPDLLARRGSDALYIECVCKRKGHGVEAFLFELANKIDPKLEIKRVFNPPSNQASPPPSSCTESEIESQSPHESSPPAFACNESEIETLLDRALTPLLDDRFLGQCREEARRHYPVVVYDGQEDGRKFCIVMGGCHWSAYHPPEGVPGKGSQNAHGTPACTLKVSLPK